MFAKNEFLELKDEAWLIRQRQAGAAVAESLKEFAAMIKNGGNITLRDIESMAVSVLKNHKCTPTFLHYKGSGGTPFPGAVCLSVNEVLVHGVPSKQQLMDGDVVTLDLGATFEGAIADAAFTCIFGEPKNKKHIELLQTCQNSLNNAIEAIKPGLNLGIIGYTIYNTVKDSGFGLITDYGGHGISYNKPHAEPFVSNKAKLTDGPRLQPGLTLAIEPMLVMNGHTKTRLLGDKWSIVTKDIGCHFESTIFIHEDKVEIITDHGMKI